MASLTSCGDFLDKSPDTRVYLQNVEQLRELMLDAYVDASYAPVCELPTDNIIDNNSPDDEGTLYNKTEYSLGDNQLYIWEDVDASTNSNDDPSGPWQRCYRAIAACNAVLDAADEIEAEGLDSDDQETLNGVRGEAYMSRAFHHFLLAQIFCMPYRGPELSKSEQGIPYMTEPETTVKPHYERGTLAETYEHIQADIEKGLALIDDGIYEVPKYHFNKQAANAFAARFYLFTRQYDKVVEYATAAFNGNDPATLMSDIWEKGGSMYYISDIGRYATSIDRPGVFMLFSSFTTWWRRFVSSGRYACNRDAKRATVQGPGPTWKNLRWRNNRNESFSMHPCFNGLCGSASGSEYGMYYAGNCFEQFEYTNKIAGIGYCHGVNAEFTAEQTLLDRAEAYLFLGNIEAAVADLSTWEYGHSKSYRSQYSQLIELTADAITNFYREDKDPGFGIMKEIHVDQVCPSDKYSLTDEIKPYLQCVQHFRRIETVHTGRRWWDIKRFGLTYSHKYGPYDTYTLQVLDKRYAIQIPVQSLVAGFEPNTRETSTEITSSEAVRPITVKPAQDDED